MVLIVGLGNPGEKYEKTRHNIGARIVGELKPLNLEGVILAEPTTFMNESGRAVKSLTTKYKTLTTNLWVIHDDIDLPLGKIKIVKNRGSAGHKGVQSIIDTLGTKDFIRFRIGIKPTTYNSQLTTADKFVLKNFTKDEEKILKDAASKIIEAIQLSLKEGLEKAMNKYNPNTTN